MTQYEPLTAIEEYFTDNPPTAYCSVEFGALIMFPAKFVEYHVALLKANPGNKIYNPYFKRLHAYYEFCKYGVVPDSHIEWEKKAKIIQL